MHMNDLPTVNDVVIKAMIEKASKYKEKRKNYKKEYEIILANYQSLEFKYNALKVKQDYYETLLESFLVNKSNVSREREFSLGEDFSFKYGNKAEYEKFEEEFQKRAIKD